MTTSPVISIADELIADLEIFALYGEGTDSGIKASEVEALLAERASLIKDAGRLEKLAAHMRLVYGMHDTGAWDFPEVVIKSNREECTADHLRSAIDSMESDDV